MSATDKVTIPCMDGFRRSGTVGVWTAPSSGQVVLVAPPAEAALLNPEQARQLGRCLHDLATIAERQHALLARTVRR